MFYLVPLMAKMMGRTLRPNTQRLVSSTVVVYNTQPKPDKKVEEKSVEQLREEKKHAREVSDRRLSDSLNTDYFD